MSISPDQLWLWGMKTNVLQATNFSPTLASYPSTLSADDALRQTGIPNFLVAGALPISAQTLAAVPSAKRIICKWSLHGHDADKKPVLNVPACVEQLKTAQQLAQRDQRIVAFLVDDFSTGTLDAGLDEAALRPFLQARESTGRRLDLMATIYSMSLDRPELRPMLRHFDSFLMPLWHADQIDELSRAADRLSEMTAGKPSLLCLYVYDFGNDRLLPGDLMRRHLEVGEAIVNRGAATGIVLLGTCLMDLPWDANRVVFEWLEELGVKPGGAPV